MTKLPNECECGKPTNGKLRCSSCGCHTCNGSETFENEDGYIIICWAGFNIDDHSWNDMLFLDEVSHFDNTNCTLYHRRKSEK